tara:strand:+ start:194 stop:430 length:237 start_codon:yes stop_codon:yes gene_type:complete
LVEVVVAKMVHRAEMVVVVGVKVQMKLHLEQVKALKETLAAELDTEIMRARGVVIKEEVAEEQMLLVPTLTELQVPAA